MVAVGVLAALVNVVTLVIIAVSDRCLSITVRNFVAARLHRDGRAPVLHDSDTYIFNVPRSAVKFFRNPAILISILCGVGLIAAELVTELGVGVSNTCSVVKRVGQVITPGDSSRTSTTVELGASAYFMQTINFLDGKITRVPAGFPKSANGTECLKCMNKKDNPDIVSGCTLKNVKSYPPGSLLVFVRTTKGPFGTVATGFQETTGAKKSFMGFGDLTGNGEHRATFVVAHSDNPQVKNLIYMEYGNQTECDNLILLARDKNGSDVSAVTGSTVIQQQISCKVNHLSVENFADALMVYRTIQLENQKQLAQFNETAQRFADISEEDIYRAVLSLKVSDDDNNKGTFFVYRTCGVYNWKFFIPLGIFIACIGVLAAVSYFSSTSERLHIPYTARSWSRRALAAEMRTAQTLFARRVRYFDGIQDEMVLVPGGAGVNGSRIELRSPSRIYEPFSQNYDDDCGLAGPPRPRFSADDPGYHVRGHDFEEYVTPYP